MQVAINNALQSNQFCSGLYAFSHSHRIWVNRLVEACRALSLPKRDRGICTYTWTPIWVLLLFYRIFQWLVLWSIYNLPPGICLRGTTVRTLWQQSNDPFRSSPTCPDCCVRYWFICSNKVQKVPLKSLEGLCSHPSIQGLGRRSNCVYSYGRTRS